MKLRLYSDLHNEFDMFEIPVLEDETDTVLILAGDIGVSRKHGTYDRFLAEAAERFRGVVYVPGNHEYYGSSWEQAWQNIQDMTGQFDNLHYLNRGTVQYDDVLFVGATLWTSFRDGNPLDMEEARAWMSDYKSIKHIRDGQYVGRLQPVTTWNDHRASLAYILEMLGQGEGRKVVVTHHAPSWQSETPEFSGEILNSAYLTDLEDEIIEYEPDLWVHGHVHTSHDYWVGKTRVKANPRGYFTFKMENPDFDDTGMIELPELAGV
jgi:predicted phosphohydrolase